MTSNALPEKIQALAAKFGVDPSLAIRCLPAAEELARHTKRTDIVLWPLEQGGLAWEVVDKSLNKSRDKQLSVYCVTWDLFPQTKNLWKEIDTLASAYGNRIIPVRLSFSNSSNRQQSNPQFIQRFLNKFFPASNPATGKLPGEFNSDVL
ncbi:MAG: hypothetical protein KAH21_07955, partial [Spirochaetaceae bacterium]|nr:hypothetical protein [Spirochaetaceae bacterium]